MGLEVNNKNYRLISNLALLGKLIERQIDLQTEDHM